MRKVRTQILSTSCLLFALFFFAPVFASAATPASIDTTSLLPAGSTSCAPAGITSVTSHVYNGALNSFDIILTNASYVEIDGSVGGNAIPLRQMTRSITPDRQLHMHTDVSIPLARDTQVTVTILSGEHDMLCATRVMFVVPAQYTGRMSMSAGNPSASQQSSGGQGNTARNSPSAPRAPIAPSTISHRSLADMCVASGAFQLWFILIVLYAGLAALAALIQPQATQRTPAIPVSLILVPLVLLIGFWYFVPVCRAASWIPIALLIIAIASLLVTFREEREGGRQMLLDSKSSNPPVRPMPETIDQAGKSSASETTQRPVSSGQNPHLQKIQEKLREFQEKQKNGKDPSSQENK